MRYFKTLSGIIVGLISVTDLDEDTVIGIEPAMKGMTRIFSKELEITYIEL